MLQPCLAWSAYALSEDLFREKMLGLQQVGNVLLVLDVWLSDPLEADEIVYGWDSETDFVRLVLYDRRLTVASIELDPFILGILDAPVKEEVVYFLIPEKAVTIGSLVSGG